MQGKRTERVGQLLQMEISRLVLSRVKDPRLGFVTITHVDVAPDLRTARVYYSAMGDEKAKKDTQKALEKAAGFLQKAIGETVIIRYTPKLTFIFDDSYDRGLEIERILRDLDQKKE